MRAAVSPTVFIRAKVLPRFNFLLMAPRRDLVKAAVFIAVMGAAGLLFNTEFGVFVDLSETRCLPERLYVGYPRTEKLNRGDIVSFQANHELMLNLMTGKRIAKIIAGVPGDHVVSNGQGAFVNGVKVGERNPLSLVNIAAQGKAPVNIDRVLGPGELFVVGTLPRSFDSRYWGILPASSVDRLVKGLI